MDDVKEQIEKVLAERRTSPLPQERDVLIQLRDWCYETLEGLRLAIAQCEACLEYVRNPPFRPFQLMDAGSPKLMLHPGISRYFDDNECRVLYPACLEKMVTESVLLAWMDAQCAKKTIDDILPRGLQFPEGNPLSAWRGPSELELIAQGRGSRAAYAQLRFLVAGLPEWDGISPPSFALKLRDQNFRAVEGVVQSLLNRVEIAIQKKPDPPNADSTDSKDLKRRVLEYASKHLKGKSLRIVELVCSSPNPVRLSELAIDSTIQWQAPYEAAWTGAQGRINKSLKSIKARLFRNDGAISVEKLKLPGPVEGHRRSKPR